MSPAPEPPLLDRAISLFKKALGDGDAASLNEFLRGVPPEESARFAPAFLEFLSAERARLIKLRTLGLTHGAGDRIRMIDDLVARCRHGGE